MARPLSEEKRSAILTAATGLVAAQGTGAPTAKIAKEAGLAEGTLFTYFANKDELLNQLYIDIKVDLAAAIMDAFPSGGGVRERCHHVWNAYVTWGSAYPTKRKAMRQLRVSEKITEQSRQRGSLAFRDVNHVFDELADSAGVERDAAFAGALFESLAETTLEFMARAPGRHEHYRQAGFDVLWSGIAG